jgi:hypothetical protein
MLIITNGEGIIRDDDKDGVFTHIDIINDSFARGYFTVIDKMIQSHAPRYFSHRRRTDTEKSWNRYE